MRHLRLFPARRQSNDAMQPSPTPRAVIALRMTASVHRQIVATVGRLRPETGMILGGDRVDGIVRHVFFDDAAQRTGTTYSPDVDRLNTLLGVSWNPAGIHLLGFVHSHPEGFATPSTGDVVYGERILDANPQLPRLLLPIVTQVRSSIIHGFALERNRSGNRLVALDLEVIKEVLAGSEAPEPAPRTALGVASARATREGTFQRVQRAYDLSLLSFSRVVVVGCGGSASWVEDMARAGVGEFVLLDPDVIAESNLATQQVARRDLDRPKVEALAERILDINPLVTVIPRQVGIQEISDEEMAELLGLEDERPPLRSLLCGFTDDFNAQARVNRLALQFGLPSLCAQVYAEGRGAEITFTHPDVTPACHRCVLRSRFDAYVEQGYRNEVTSNGTPIFATARLNAIKGFVALALLHHGTTHPRWGGLLRRIGDRNLVQIRMDPDLGLAVFERVLTGDPSRLLFDETVWLPQPPEGGHNGRPPCPDCGGGGDLRLLEGAFGDTRALPRTWGDGRKESA